MKKIPIKTPIKLLDALKGLYPDSSMTTLRSLLKNKQVLVDGKTTVQANLELISGQVLSVESLKKVLPHAVKTIYEDANLVIINKPEGLLSVPLDNKESIHALGILQKHYPNNSVYAVHRLDRDTSGIMMFAKTKKAKELLKEMFQKHDIKRVYLAIVDGVLDSNKGRWESHLVEMENLRVKTIRNPKAGQLAITDYQVIKKSKSHSFLRLSLKTGKKHQIRVHCKDAGHPIIGDTKYHPNPEKGSNRLCLHSYYLEFFHPLTKRVMKFSAPFPHSMKTLGFSI